VTDGSENVCLATRMARVLIFPVIEANVVSGPAKGVIAIKLDPRDRVLGFALANKMREAFQARTNRGALFMVRATKYPVTSRGGRGYAVMQRGSLESIEHDEARPVPPMEQVVE
jgi:DNA gyrase subunit A